MVSKLRIMRQCLVIEKDWIEPMLRKLHEIDPPRLMGGKPLPHDAFAPRVRFQIIRNART